MELVRRFFLFLLRFGDGGSMLMGWSWLEPSRDRLLCRDLVFGRVSEMGVGWDGWKVPSLLASKTKEKIYIYTVGVFFFFFWNRIRRPRC